MVQERKLTREESSSKDESLMLGPIPKVATGLPAILKSADVSLRAMGIVRSGKAWTSINQRQGFDCPSCAWADPEDYFKVLSDGNHNKLIFYRNLYNAITVRVLI